MTIRSLEKKLQALVQEFTYAQVVEGLRNLCVQDAAEENKVEKSDAEEFVRRAASNNEDMFSREAAVLKKAAKALGKIEEELMG